MKRSLIFSKCQIWEFDDATEGTGSETPWGAGAEAGVAFAVAGDSTGALVDEAVFREFPEQPTKKRMPADPKRMTFFMRVSLSVICQWPKAQVSLV